MTLKIYERNGFSSVAELRHVIQIMPEPAAHRLTFLFSTEGDTEIAHSEISHSDVEIIKRFPFAICVDLEEYKLEVTT